MLHACVYMYMHILTYMYSYCCFAFKKIKTMQWYIQNYITKDDRIWIEFKSLNPSDLHFIVLSSMDKLYGKLSLTLWSRISFRIITKSTDSMTINTAYFEESGHESLFVTYLVEQILAGQSLLVVVWGIACILLLVYVRSQWRKWIVLGPKSWLSGMIY